MQADGIKTVRFASFFCFGKEVKYMICDLLRFLYIEETVISAYVYNSAIADAVSKITVIIR